MTCYNIEGISRHRDDLTSITTWISEWSFSYNSIILFKEQGKIQDKNMDNLEDDDFFMHTNRISMRYATKIWTQHHIHSTHDTV